jgi:hypothetical protein
MGIADQRGDDRVIVAIEIVMTAQDIRRGANGLAGSRPVERNRLEVDESFPRRRRSAAAGFDMGVIGVGIRACRRR